MDSFFKLSILDWAKMAVTLSRDYYNMKRIYHPPLSSELKTCIVRRPYSQTRTALHYQTYLRSIYTSFCKSGILWRGPGTPISFRTDVFESVVAFSGNHWTIARASSRKGRLIVLGQTFVKHLFPLRSAQTNAHNVLGLCSTLRYPPNPEAS